MKKILSVTLEREPDTDPDLAFLGTYGETATSTESIDRAARGEQRAHEYRWFNPSDNYDDATPEERATYVEQDYKRMQAYEQNEWGMVGVTAVARVQLTTDGPTQKITSGSVWNVASDADASEFAEIEHGQLEQLRKELRAIGFPQRAITDAFSKKRSERSEG